MYNHIYAFILHLYWISKCVSIFINIPYSDCVLIGWSVTWPIELKSPVHAKMKLSIENYMFLSLPYRVSSNYRVSFQHISTTLGGPKLCVAISSSTSQQEVISSSKFRQKTHTTLMLLTYLGFWPVSFTKVYIYQPHVSFFTPLLQVLYHYAASSKQESKILVRETFWWTGRKVK